MKLRALLTLAAVLVVVWVSRLPRSPALSPWQFADCLERCSEKGHDFISDNWVSNETAYGDHLNYLRRTVPKGSVYVGVGPEQNFSYIAALQPCYAFIVDIRRGNLLQHLYFKFLFEECELPQQWLAALLGRRYRGDLPDPGFPRWLTELDSVAPDEALVSELQGRFRIWLSQRGLNLPPQDWEFLTRMQAEFASRGLQLRFEYRRPRPGKDEPLFPTFLEVLQATDSQGQPANFLGSVESYRRVRQMQKENRIIPVIGDFAGQHALSEIAGRLRAQNLTVGLFYASNVEFYLMPRQQPGQKMERFLFNLEGLPTTPETLLLRTHLDNLRGSTPYPRGKPVFIPRIQRLQRFVNDYFAGRLPDYPACMLNNDLSRSAEALR